MASENHGYKFWREKLNGAKFILAPMVEQSELPWRMLSRKYNSQLCYTPMMHAGVFLRDPTYRVENFVTCPEDKPLIAQFCSDDPNLFLNAAKVIENQCDAIDLNLGCPQNIARRGHYGSFLQDEWELIHDILSKAVTNLKIPVTAKIRVFQDINKSVEYAKMIESTGISLLTVHGRTREQKGPDTGLASWKHIKAIKDAVKIPVFANGNILCFDDVLRCMEETGCDGVMIAEPNLYNPGLFSNMHPPTWQMALEYLDYVQKYPCSFTCVRGHLFKIFHKVFERHTDLRDKMAKLKDMDEIRQTIGEIEDAIKKNNEAETSDDEKIVYWRCQPYIRPISSEVAIRDNEELRKSGSDKLPADFKSSEDVKKHLEELNDNLNKSLNDDEKKAAIKLAKLFERRKRKLERTERKLKHYNETHQDKLTNKIKRTKFVQCNNCKNPKSDQCEHNMCRKCCKDKVFQDLIECKGHGLRCKKQPATTEEPNNSLQSIENQNSALNVN